MEEMNWFMCCRLIGENSVEKKKKKKNSIEENKDDKTVASFAKDIAWKSAGSAAQTSLLSFVFLLSFQSPMFVYDFRFSHSLTFIKRFSRFSSFFPRKLDPLSINCCKTFLC